MQVHWETLVWKNQHSTFHLEFFLSINHFIVHPQHFPHLKTGFHPFFIIHNKTIPPLSPTPPLNLPLPLRYFLFFPRIAMLYKHLCSSTPSGVASRTISMLFQAVVTLAAQFILYLCHLQPTYISRALSIEKGFVFVGFSERALNNLRACVEVFFSFCFITSLRLKYKLYPEATMLFKSITRCLRYAKSARVVPIRNCQAAPENAALEYHHNFRVNMVFKLLKLYWIARRSCKIFVVRFVWKHI